MKKLFLLVFIFLLSGVLVSCGGNNNDTKDDDKTNKNEVAAKKKDPDTTKINEKYKELSKPLELEGTGKATLIKTGYSDTFNLDGTDKPIKAYKFSELDFTVLETHIFNLALSEEGKISFNENGPLQWISFKVRYYNHSNSDVLIDNSFTGLTTTGFKDLAFYSTMSDDFGGVENPIKPNETREGFINFIDDGYSDFSKATLNVAINYEERKAFEFEYLPLKESIQRDM
ncbi:hypothetical protein [Listeria rustica]|uniref:DUF5068 domain-containing protein n=1 Tax=Listeria rustica TaxID=2713503 RepID=A0A7W1T6Z9_9LIST|nr:hypothetical protein [Listeria rustica]MBA3926589.1 hypothetical protein [Listeria rustica]